MSLYSSSIFDKSIIQKQKITHIILNQQPLLKYKNQFNHNEHFISNFQFINNILTINIYRDSIDSLF